MKVREHRGGLDASMATVVEIEPTFEALAEHFSKIHQEKYQASDIKLNYYGCDPRIGWNQYLVTIKGLPHGFTNSDVEGGVAIEMSPPFLLSAVIQRSKIIYMDEVQVRVPNRLLLSPQGVIVLGGRYISIDQFISFNIKTGVAEVEYLNDLRSTKPFGKVWMRFVKRVVEEPVQVKDIRNPSTSN